MPTFDLTQQRWIPVVVGGKVEEVSLREALLRSHEIDELALDEPLQAVAVFRQMLLPVVLHALGVPRTADEWEMRYRAGRFDPGTVTGYLDEHADRFDLFHPSRPFAQIAGLRTGKNETKPISLLIPRVASGNNVPLFSARTDADPPVLSPAQAARAVLSAHCWDTAAIKSGAVGDHQMRAGKTTGNPTGPLGQLGVVTPMGSSLFETLMLSVPTLPQGFQRADRPQWATDDPPDANWDSGRQPAGLLDLLTWQARRVRLVVGDENSGDEIGISRVVLCAGDRIGVLPHDVEPHTGWKRVDRPKAGESPQRPDRHQPGRSAWRGLAALIATKEPTSEHKSAPTAMNHVAGLRLSGVLPDEFPLRALLVGVVYGNQAAVIEDVIVDVLPLPMLALLDQDANDVRDMLLAVVGQAEQLRLAANHLGDDLRAATGVEKLPWDKGQRLGEVLVHLFDPSVRRLLAGLQRHPGDAERAELAWRLVARRLAWSVAEPALNAVPATTFLGRGLDERYPARVATAEAKFRRRLTDILGPAQPTVAA